MRKVIAIVLLIGLLLLAFTGCGASSQVPDSTIYRDVECCEYYDFTGMSSWDAVHHVDRESHYDDVDITITTKYPYATLTTTNRITYRYDRSSDLWRVEGQSGWSDPVCQYNDNLEQEWNMSWFDNNYIINIRSVDGNRISLEYEIAERVYGGIFEDYVMCYASGSGTYEIDGDHLKIPVELPDGFYAAKRSGYSYQIGYISDLFIQFSPTEGIELAYMTPEINYSSD